MAHAPLRVLDKPLRAFTLGEEETTRKVIAISIGNTAYVIGNPFARLNALLRRLFERLRRKPEPPGYPYADKFAPVRRGPKGRSGAAVIDPEEDGSPRR